MSSPALAKWLAATAVIAVTACAGPSESELGTPNADTASLLRIAETTRAAGDPAAAVQLYRRAHALSPEDPTPLIRLGETFNALGAYTEASEAWTNALTLDANNADILRGYGITLTGLNQPHLALERFNSAAALNPEPRTYNGIGVAYDMLGQPETAQANYRAGLALDPADIGLTSNLGLSFALSGRYAEAIAMLERAATMPNATVRHRQNLALAYGVAGETEKAERLARVDLDEQAVLQNMAFYNTLRAMTDHAQKVAALGRLNQRIAPANGAL